LIWKGTEKVGFGFARSKDKRSAYIVAHYYPPGNYEKDYKKNVPPPERGRVYKPTNMDLSK
uniref:Golgi-associated plant pathogenesis-related protein 1 n=1 Tax=Schistocephalus solidus TaxID=70667 RepID=A0A183TQD3_SCHSO